ncbi:hypothetical protein TNCV_716401 [Trichonephila clavipes]|nr:hypothetical protein TNCV_716401 [Trichonephila clavipes]
MFSPGFEPSTYDTAVNVANHYTGWETQVVAARRGRFREFQKETDTILEIATFILPFPLYVNGIQLYYTLAVIPVPRTGELKN